MNIRCFVAATLALSLCACGSVQHRQDYNYHRSMVPIEVIDSNYVESTNDAEIVFIETPWQTCTVMAAVTAA